MPFSGKLGFAALTDPRENVRRFAAAAIGAIEGGPQQ